LKSLKKLVAWADVVADSHRPGVLESWDLAYEDLKKINPSVILVRIPTRVKPDRQRNNPAWGIILTA